MVIGAKMNFSTILSCAFVQKNLAKGVSPDTIKEYLADFFESSSLCETRKLLFLKLFPNEVPSKRVGANAALNCASDIISSLVKCDSQNIKLPDFVIKCPSEVPMIPVDAFSTLSAKVNSCLEQLRDIASKVTEGQSKLVAPTQNTKKPSYAVVVRNPPPELSDPILRMKKLETLDGHDGIVSLKSKPHSKSWVVMVRDKRSADSLAEAVTSSIPNVETKVIDKKPLAVVREIPHNYSRADLEASVEGLISANQIGNSRTFRLEFIDKTALNAVLESGIRIGYEIFRAKPFQSIPRRCFRCQSTDHLIGACPRSPAHPKCSRCSGPHVNSKENPCQASPKCANCTMEHVSFSLKCKVLRSALNNANK